ncbi:MAG: LysR family transcriptional regulator [Gammaproteobacteria bacterium]|nr:LysR family transcriptional regulator [Gammaproteobacteria bacterium]
MIEANKIQQLDFNLLKVFESLYLERNMTTVANILFISPSAVSHAIKRLRLVLNDQLFVRQGQQMQPTPLCQTLAPQLIETLGKLRQILQTCGDFELKNTQQTFKLAIHDVIEPAVLRNIQHAMAIETPQAKLSSVKLIRAQMNRQLATNQIDVAIDIALPIKKPINHLFLSSDHFCVLMDKSHVLANGLTPESYIAAQHLVVSSRAFGSSVEDLALLQQGINRDINIRCQSYQSAKMMLKGTALMLTLPRLIAMQLIDSDLIIKPLPYELPQVSSHLYWHQKTDQDQSLIWFRKIVKQSLDAVTKEYGSGI